MGMKARIAVKIRFGSVFIVRFLELFCDARNGTYMNNKVNNEAATPFFVIVRRLRERLRGKPSKRKQTAFLGEMVGLSYSIFHKPLESELILKKNFIPDGEVKVGITSGASTPDKVVADVIEKLIAITK